MCLNKNYVDFAKYSSIHGIKYIVDSNTRMLERIFWFMIIIVSLSFSVYLTILFWSRYTSNPTRTIVQTNSAPLNTVAFPAITICNLNKVLESKIEKFVAKLDGNADELLITKNVLSNSMPEIISLKASLNITEISITEDILEQNGYSDIKKLMARISQSCEEMIENCAWNRVPVRCKDIFEETYTVKGRCCSFNYIKKGSSKNPLQTLYSGLANGLKITLVPGFNTRSMAGVSVTVHNPTDFPNDDNDVKKTLPLGGVNYLQIEASKQLCSDEVKALSSTYRRCVYSNERKLEYFNEYSYTDCLTSCEVKTMIEKCKCVPYYYDFIYGKGTCNFGHSSCLRNISIDTFNTCNCSLQCEDEFYQVLLSYTKFTNNSNVWMADYGQKSNDMEKSIFLNVFFAKNQQAIWERDTIMSAISLVSSFGGIYSLFLGCSMITVIEIIYFFILKCVIENMCISKKINQDKEREEDKIFTFQHIPIAKKLAPDNYSLGPIFPYTE